MSRADAFGIALGADTDKFARTGFTPVKAEKVDTPCAGECPVVPECRVSKIVEIAAHTQFIGETPDIKINEMVPGADGKPELAKINALAFEVVRSEYFGPGMIVGKAFSTGKSIFPETFLFPVRCRHKEAKNIISGSLPEARRILPR